MALGSNNYHGGNGNNNKGNWEATYYSRIRIKNTDQNLALNFSFWKGTLKIYITEINSENRNELAYIHLSPTKSRIMAENVQRIIASDEDQSFGVDTGISSTRGFIAVGRDKGIPYLMIAKVTENGSYESAQKFVFNNNYNYTLHVHDVENLKCQKEFMNNVELEQLRDILIDHARSSSGAYAYATHDINRYEASRASRRINEIAQAVGINTNSHGNGDSGKSFFSNDSYQKPAANNNSSNNRSKYDSIDDLEGELN